MRLLLLFILAWSGAAFACPDGHYETCALPRPWPLRGCAQTACIPNGGTILDGASDNLKDLNKGVIQLGNGVVNTTAAAGQSLGNVAGKMDWGKVQNVDWAAAVWIASAIYNGAMCLASDGVAPGHGFQGSTVPCSSNACACAAISVVMAIKTRSDMSEDENKKMGQMVNDPKFVQIMQRASTVSATNKQLSELGIKRSARVEPEPGHVEPGSGCSPRCITP